MSAYHGAAINEYCAAFNYINDVEVKMSGYGPTLSPLGDKMRSFFGEFLDLLNHGSVIEQIHVSFYISLGWSEDDALNTVLNLRGTASCVSAEHQKSANIVEVAETLKALDVDAKEAFLMAKSHVESVRGFHLSPFWLNRTPLQRVIAYLEEMKTRPAMIANFFQFIRDVYRPPRIQARPDQDTVRFCSMVKEKTLAAPAVLRDAFPIDSVDVFGIFVGYIDNTELVKSVMKYVC